MKFEPIRVALIDAHRIFLDAFSLALDQTEGFRVVSATDKPQANFETLIKQQPDIVLLDVDLPDGSAFSTAKAITGKVPQAHIAFVKGKWSFGSLERALRSGRASILSKTETVECIIGHLRRIAIGEPRFSDEIAPLVEYDRRERRYRPRIDGPLHGLNSIQLDILRYLADGESVRDIAEKMHLSPKSVESHKYRVMKLLGVTDRVRLARLLIREGLVQP